MRVFLDLMWFFKTRKKYYVGGITLLILVALLNLVAPRIVGILVDDMLRGVLTSGILLRYVIIMLATGVVIYVLRYFWRILLFGSAIQLSTLLRSQLYTHFTRMSPQFYHKQRIGDLMAHSTNDIQAVESTATDGILTLVDSITTGSVVIVTMMTTLSWKLTLIAMAPMPIVAITSSIYGSIMHRRFFKAQAAFADLNDKVQENISGMRVVKAFGQQQVEFDGFSKLSYDAVKKNIAVAKIDALFDPTIAIVVGLSYFLSIGVGAVFVDHGHLTLGQLTTFTMYLGQLVWPMLAFGFLFNVVERGHASYDRIRQLLAVRPDVVDKDNAISEQPFGAIVYDIDTFTYPETASPALIDVRMRLEPGQTLGLVGKTGAGKTTFVKLMLREFDCRDGDIRFGSHSICDYTLSALRSSVAYVPQDHFLFSATIAENIAFARPEATMAEIQRAAKLAAIHDDILRFPDGYGTVVGERGVTLSGGQKQRISIARALLMDAECLILDDSLSAVDAKTEVQILDALRAERSGKTTMITAHRLSAVEHADLILVLEDGTVRERGTHTELMALNGWYRDMYERQQLESSIEEGGVTV